MIVLAVQLRILVLSIVSGWIYGMLYSFLQLWFHSKTRFLNRIVFEVVFQSFFHITVYYLLFLLNGGIVRMYYILLFIVGLWLYYLLYYPIVIPLYIKVIYYVKIPINRINLVFSQFISIIIMLLKKVKGRFWFHNDTKYKKKSG